MAASQPNLPERWLPVVGFESFYEVSNTGFVRTMHTIGRACRVRLLSATPNRKGYLRVGLTAGPKRRAVMVHRIVAEAFIGRQPTPRHEINHKDGDKANNRVGNLEWVTPTENAKHAKETGLWRPHLGEAHGRAVLNESNVREIRSLHGIESGPSLARRFGVKPQTIQSIWKRRLWKHV